MTWMTWPHPHVGVVLVALLLLLATATAVALWRIQRSGGGTKEQELWDRVKTWWVLVALFGTALLMSRTVMLGFGALVCFMALKEYLSLIPTRRADRRVLAVVYLATPVQFYWVHLGWYGMFIVFIPVLLFLILPTLMVLVGETSGFLRAAGTLHWGLMSTVFALSHAAYLLALPPEGNPNGGGAGLLVFLVVLTQLNDVAQFIFGRLLGQLKAVPKVSPNKTVEGLLGGVLTTTALSGFLGGYLTPLTLSQSLWCGALLGIAGFMGDVTMSAIKRDLGIKDSGTLLPGHGGVLDRVDSLTFTAPLFFHLLYYLKY